MWYTDYSLPISFQQLPVNELTHRFLRLALSASQWNHSHTDPFGAENITFLDIEAAFAFILKPQYKAHVSS